MEASETKSPLPQQARTPDQAERLVRETVQLHGEALAPTVLPLMEGSGTEDAATWRPLILSEENAEVVRQPIAVRVSRR
jgi:hypothetical protein